MAQRTSEQILILSTAAQHNFSAKKFTIEAKRNKTGPRDLIFLSKVFDLASLKNDERCNFEENDLRSVHNKRPLSSNDLSRI